MSIEIIELEGFRTGVQWSTINANPLFSVQDSLIMLVVDTILYVILGWYLGKVVPMGDSVARPWYFEFIMREIIYELRWFPLQYFMKKKEKALPEEFQPLTNENMYEQAEESDHNVTMELRGLSRGISFVIF